jgi:flagellar M-ring protein FliF
VDSFLETLKGLGLPRLALMLGITVGLFVFFIYLSARMSTPTMVLLYSELEPTDSAAIIQELDTKSVEYKVTPDGAKIMVPSDQVGKIRMALAEKGVPTGGSVGYSELFDKPQGLGTSNFVLNINKVRALQGELARTISSIDSVKNARVHLVLPDREIFTKEKKEPSASVFVVMKGSQELSREQVSAIQHIVASAVPELKSNQISIANDKGQLLARPSDENGAEGMMESAAALRKSRENDLTRKIEDVVFAKVGYGNARIQISADLDFDRITENQTKFDIDSQVVVSEQTVKENEDSNEANNPQPVTVQGNLPGGNNTGDSSSQSSTRRNRTEETVNRDTPRTERMVVQEIGRIKRLSVAVLVDGVRTKDAEGKDLYTPRSEQELKEIQRLVSSAVGLDTSRGDTIEVVNLQFERDALYYADDTGNKIFGIPSEELLKLAETLVLGLVAILVLLLIVRPLVNRLMQPPIQPPNVDEFGLLTDQTMESMAALGAPDSVDQLTDDLADVESQLEQMINISQVEGRVRASSLKRIGDIVEKHPEEAVAILRSWLYEGRDND